MRIFITVLALISCSLFARIANQKILKPIMLTDKNHVLIRGEIRSASSIKEDILKISNNLDKDAILYLVLDSPGGSVIAANEVQNVLETIPQKVETISIFAASAAFHLAQMGVRRYIAERGIMMQHRESMRAGGNTDNILALTKMIKEITTSWNQYEADRIGLSLVDFKAKVENDWWLFGKGAVKENVADESVRIFCSKELMVTKEKKIQTIFGTMTVKESNCPIM